MRLLILTVSQTLVFFRLSYCNQNNVYLNIQLVIVFLTYKIDRKCAFFTIKEMFYAIVDFNAMIISQFLMIL